MKPYLTRSACVLLPLGIENEPLRNTPTLAQLPTQNQDAFVLQVLITAERSVTLDNYTGRQLEAEVLAERICSIFLRPATAIGEKDERDAV